MIDVKSVIEREARTVVSAYKVKYSVYDSSVATLAQYVAEDVIKRLSIVCSVYKLACVCSIHNKKEGGMHMSTSTFWDSGSDINMLIKDENDGLFFLLNIFVIS